jgi:hypothetical protein
VAGRREHAVAYSHVWQATRYGKPVDGAVNANASLSSTPVTLSTTKTNDIIIVAAASNSCPAGTTAIIDTSSLTWTLRAQAGTTTTFGESTRLRGTSAVCEARGLLCFEVTRNATSETSARQDTENYC